MLAFRTGKELAHVASIRHRRPFGIGFLVLILQINFALDPRFQLQESKNRFSRNPLHERAKVEIFRSTRI